jgi:hypothetical protein
LETAFQRITKLRKENEAMPLYREELAVNHAARAAVKLARNQVADAQTDCQASIDMLNQLIEERTRNRRPENAEYFSLLGRANLLAGRIETAQNHQSEARRLRVQAIDNLRRAFRIDGARVRDQRLFLEIEGGNNTDPQSKFSP